MNPAMAKRAYRNDPYCGDQFACWEDDGKITLCMVDGLGHGAQAEKAAKAAAQYVGEHLSEPLDEIFSGCDEEIRSTRGVAMGLAVIDEKQATLTYGGIGNTSARIIGGDSVTFTGNAGIVGGGYRKINVRLIVLTPGQLLVMHTDGIAGRLDISRYSADLQQDLDKLATAIIDDWSRENDDSAVMVYRYGGKPR